MHAHFLLLLSYLIVGAFAFSSPPAGAITVGPGGKYSTLSAALKDTSSEVGHHYVAHRTHGILMNFRVDSSTSSSPGRTRTRRLLLGPTPECTGRRPHRAAIRGIVRPHLIIIADHADG